MKYVCDAPPYTWFRFETVGEATIESQLMDHAVVRYFQRSYEEAAQAYVPPKDGRYIEQAIGREPFIQRTMPMFVTLRDGDGKAHVTAMLPPDGKDVRTHTAIIVGYSNADPYPEYADAISALATHLGYPLERERCYPYARR